jgi:hypothetical protein
MERPSKQVSWGEEIFSITSLRISLNCCMDLMLPLYNMRMSSTQIRCVREKYELNMIHLMFLEVDHLVDEFSVEFFYKEEK